MWACNLHNYNSRNIDNRKYNYTFSNRCCHSGKENLIWQTVDNEIPRNLSSSGWKEHLHVYSEMDGGAKETEYAAPFHTDNGLLLMITPFQAIVIVVILIQGWVTITNLQSDWMRGTAQ